MKKILIIPSWYPTVSQSLAGSFFREQALLVEGYQVFVLYGVKKKFGLSAWKRRGSVPRDTLLTPPAGESFGYFQIKKRSFHKAFSLVERLVDQVNLLLLKRAFRKRCKTVMESGFTPDLIHAQCTYWGGVAANYLGKEFNIPTVITEHQLFLLQLYRPFEQLQIKRALSQANKLLVVSEHQKRTILINDIHCRPVVVGNLIDEEMFRPAEREESGVFKILYVSYQNWLKDNDTFFQAIKSMVEKGFLDIEVLVIGGDPWQAIGALENNPLFKIASRFQVEQRCRFTGNVARDEMARLYQEADLFVSTSVAETFGVSACEALCCGLPVVATRNGGMDDFLNNENSIQVDIQDFEAVADAVIKIKNKEVRFDPRSEEHTSELQSRETISYAVFCLKKSGLIG